MGIFSPSQNRFYVPPTGGRSTPDGTLLGALPPTPSRAPWYSSDPNVVRASDDEGRVEDGGARVEVGQQAQAEPSRASTNYHLKFDGRYLKLFNGDEIVREWPGVFGREHFGSDRDQEKRNYGPIPEGTYDIKQSRYQEMDPIRQRFGGIGRWPSGTDSWGTERVWADPTNETVKSGLSFGRSGMAIHGGTEPGSAGCVDLTGQMGDFAKTFRRLGHDP